MPRKKKRFARAQRFVKKHTLILNVLIMMLSLILPLIVGQEFVIIKTVRQINLDVIDAYAHASASLKINVFATVIIQNASGTFVLTGT